MQRLLLVFVLDVWLVVEVVILPGDIGGGMQHLRCFLRGLDMVRSRCVFEEVEG